MLVVVAVAAVVPVFVLALIRGHTISLPAERVSGGDLAAAERAVVVAVVVVVVVATIMIVITTVLVVVLVVSVVLAELGVAATVQ